MFNFSSDFKVQWNKYLCMSGFFIKHAELRKNRFLIDFVHYFVWKEDFSIATCQS
jgi:hypothetical protein